MITFISNTESICSGLVKFENTMRYFMAIGAVAPISRRSMVLGMSSDSENLAASFRRSHCCDEPNQALLPQTNEPAGEPDASSAVRVRECI